jgi:hypothetical protein
VIFNRNTLPNYRGSPDIVTHLQRTGILTAEDAYALRQILKENYRLIEIQNREFWVRNDIGTMDKEW